MYIVYRVYSVYVVYTVYMLRTSWTWCAWCTSCLVYTVYVVSTLHGVYIVHIVYILNAVYILCGVYVVFAVCIVYTNVRRHHGLWSKEVMFWYVVLEYVPVQVYVPSVACYSSSSIVENERTREPATPTTLHHSSHTRQNKLEGSRALLVWP